MNRSRSQRIALAILSLCFMGASNGGYDLGDQPQVMIMDAKTGVVSGSSASPEAKPLEKDEKVVLVPGVFDEVTQTRLVIPVSELGKDHPKTYEVTVEALRPPESKDQAQKIDLESAFKKPDRMGESCTHGNSTGFPAPLPNATPVTDGTPPLYSDNHLQDEVDRETVLTGSTATPAENRTVASGSNLEVLQEAARLSDQARTQELLEGALAARRALKEKAAADQKALNRYYIDVPLSGFAQRMNRARQTLDSQEQLLRRSTGGLSDGERARFGNYYRNARDLAGAALDSLSREMTQKKIAENTFFSKYLSPENFNPLARTKSLAEIFGATADDDSATSQEALLNRLIMFSGLDDKQQNQLSPRLNLAESVNVETENGIQQPLLVLHNGYIFGAGKTALDCSSFVSAVLPAEVRTGRFTTLDFRTMWLYQKTGKVNLPPRYKKARLELVKRTSEAFIPIDLYANERLSPGDLLVYRLPWEASGHIFIVRNYNGHTMTATVIEAAQSAGTVRERSFPLSFDDPDEFPRFIRPGLMALRLRPIQNEVCTYRDGQGLRSPSGAPPKRVHSRSPDSSPSQNLPRGAQ